MLLLYPYRGIALMLTLFFSFNVILLYSLGPSDPPMGIQYIVHKMDFFCCYEFRVRVWYFVRRVASYIRTIFICGFCPSCSWLDMPVRRRCSSSHGWCVILLFTPYQSSVLFFSHHTAVSLLYRRNIYMDGWMDD